jgi:5'(3')-deoxyribonucleotidase
MSKPKIAIDLDDVLADSTEAYRLQVNQRTGADLTAAHYKVPGEYHRYYHRVWKQHGIFDRVPVDELDREMAADQSHIPASDGALETLRYLGARYELVVMTARKPDWQPATRRWIAERYPDIFSEIVFAGSQHNEVQESKGEACARVGAAYLIDDNFDHAGAAIHKGIQVIVFGDYGWHFKLPPSVTRCRTWREVKEYFDGQRS